MLCHRTAQLHCHQRADNGGQTPRYCRGRENHLQIHCPLSDHYDWPTSHTQGSTCALPRVKREDRHYRDHGAQSETLAEPPRHQSADWDLTMPTHKRGFARWELCSEDSATTCSGPWLWPGQSEQRQLSETSDPIDRNRDTPNYLAWKSHHRHRDVASRHCLSSAARPVEQGGWGHH